MNRFIIVCAPRTGSTMLRLMLNEHPDIICKGEIIVPHKIKRKKAIEFFEKEVFHKNKTSGFKFKYKQFFEQYPEVRDEIIKSTDIKIIHMMRKNLIKRHISNKIAGRTGVNLVRKSSEKPEQVKIKINFNRLIKDIEKNEYEIKKIKKIFKNHEIFNIYYEDFYPEIDRQVLNNLQKFLGVESLDLKPLTKKLIKII